MQGALTAVPMGFILPTLAYVRVKSEPLRSWGNVIPICVATLGFVMLVLGVAQVVSELANGITCATGNELPYCQTNSTFNSTS